MADFKADAGRMYEQALVRIEDGNQLRDLKTRKMLGEEFPSPASRSDSPSLLRILGFEILLKCVRVVRGEKPDRTHCYLRLWNKLPADARSEIMDGATKRIPNVDLSKLHEALKWWQYVFERGRYFYEEYEGWSEKEVHDYTQLWLELGAPVEEADIRYYPEVLTCLIAGLTAYIKARL